MTMTLSYLQILAQLTVLILAGGILARTDGWFAPSKEPGRPPFPGMKWGDKFLTYRAHGAVWGMAIFGNPAADYVFDTYAGQWSVVKIGWAGLASALFVTFLIEDWRKDPVPSVFFRNGQPTAPLFLFALSITIIFTAAVLYYTATGNVDPNQVAVVTMAFGLCLAFALLAPPFVVHGYIHGKAWVLFVGAAALLLVGRTVVLNYPWLHF